MKKSIFLFAILLIGALSISATIEKQLLGKWYVHSLKMMDNEETFDDENAAPWMEFKDDNMLLLGEPDRTPKDSEWKYDKATNILILDSFGEELEFTVKNITDVKLILEAEQDGEAIMTLVLKRQL